MISFAFHNQSTVTNPWLCASKRISNTWYTETGFTRDMCVCIYIYMYICIYIYICIYMYVWSMHSLCYIYHITYIMVHINQTYINSNMTHSHHMAIVTWRVFSSVARGRGHSRALAFSGSSGPCGPWPWRGICSWIYHGKTWNINIILMNIIIIGFQLGVNNHLQFIFVHIHDTIRIWTW